MTIRLFRPYRAIEGVPTEGPGVLRVAVLVLTGVADPTQVQVELQNEWNAEDLAEETLDTDTPTAGTNFDIAAAGTSLTVKGLGQRVRAVVAEHIHQEDAGTSYTTHFEVVAGLPVLELRNAITGAILDLSALTTGKVVEIGFSYITE